MYVTLRWEAIIMLCENLHFGASLHLRCMGVWLGLGWVGSMKWTHGQLWYDVFDRYTVDRQSQWMQLTVAETVPRDVSTCVVSLRTEADAWRHVINGDQVSADDTAQTGNCICVIYVEEALGTRQRTRLTDTWYLIGRLRARRHAFST